MRRVAATSALVAACAGGALAHAQAPRLQARLAACETGADAADRFAVFTGSMPSEEGAATLAMRFDLLERAPGASFQRVELAHWSVWERTSKPGVPGFIFTKRVEELAAPATFRAVVSFRWFDAKGKLVRSARRTSAVCRQPDWRADLRVKRVTFPSGKGPMKIVVGNRGRGAAGAFGVTASRSDFVVGRTVAGVAAGEQVTVAIPLGRCVPGETITVVLDPAGQVDEADEARNTTTVTCPQP